MLHIGAGTVHIHKWDDTILGCMWVAMFYILDSTGYHSWIASAGIHELSQSLYNHIEYYTCLLSYNDTLFLVACATSLTYALI